MTASPEVREEAMRFLPWIWLFPLASFGSYIFDGIFIGATLSREMRNVMAISIAIYLVVLVVSLPPLGNHGLWLALIAMNLARTVLMGCSYSRAEAKAMAPA
jgi:MATE family multidrug resistance protein